MRINQVLVVLLIISLSISTSNNIISYAKKNVETSVHTQGTELLTIFKQNSKIRLLSNPTHKFRIMQEPPSNGTWIINTTVIIENQELVLNCSIVVEEQGILIINNSTLILNQTANGMYNIEVKDGGNLTLKHSSITSNASYRYGIFVRNNSRIGLFDSNLTNLGFNETILGLYIENSSLITSNFEITSGYIGIYLNNTRDIIITDGYISTTESIRIYNSDNISMRNLNLEVPSGGKGVTLNYTSKITIENSSFESRGEYSIGIFNSGNIRIAENYFSGSPTRQVYAEKSRNVVIIENHVNSIKTYGIYLFASRDAIIQNNFFVIKLSVNYDFAPPSTTINKWGLYLEDSLNITALNNSFVTWIWAKASLAGISGSYRLNTYSIYGLNVSESVITRNMFFRYIYFSIPTTSSPGISFSASYKYQAVTIKSSQDIWIYDNFMGFNDSYIASRDSRTIRFFYIGESRRIFVRNTIFWNISKYQTNDYIYSSNDTVIENIVYERVGVTVAYSLNVTIRNISSEEYFENSIVADHSDRIQIIDSNFNYGITAIKILYSSNVYVDNSTIINCEYAFIIRGSSQITISKTRIWDSEIKILDANSFGNVSVSDSTYNGLLLTIIGNSILNLENMQFGALILGYVTGTLKNISAFYVDVRSSSNLSILSLKIMQGGRGLLIHSSSNITIIGLKVLDSHYGLYLDNSNNVTIHNTTINDSTQAIVISNSGPIFIDKTEIINSNYGLLIDGAKGNITLESLNVEMSTYAIYLNSSVNLTFQEGLLDSNYVGLVVSKNTAGSTLLIINDTLVNNGVGIQIQANVIVTIKLCTIVSNDVGIRVDSGLSVDVTIAFNNFTDNRYNLAIYSSSILIYGNILEDGNIIVDRYLECYFNESHIGNYWGLDGTDGNGDGIIDEALRIANVYYDYHPIAYKPKIIWDGLLLAYPANNTYINWDYWVYFYSINSVGYGFYDNDSVLIQGSQNIAGIIITNDQEGLHKITLTLLEPYNLTITLITFIDITPPNIIYEFENNSYTNNSRLIISIIDSSPIEATIFINGTSLVTSNATIILDVSTFIDATYIIVIDVKDLAGNINKKTIRIMLDRTQPTLKISLSNRTYISDGQLNITLVDNLELSYVSIKINSSVIFDDSVEGTTFIYLVDLSLFKEGKIILSVTAKDKANNTASAKYIFYIDRSPPTLEDIVYPQNITTNQSYVVISIYATDNFALDRVIVEFQYNGSLYMSTAIIFENHFIAVIRVRGTGVITFNITLFDKAGNEATYGSYMIFITRRISTQKVSYEYNLWIPIIVLVAVIAALSAGLAIILKKYRAYQMELEKISHPESENISG